MDAEGPSSSASRRETRILSPTTTSSPFPEKSGSDRLGSDSPGTYRLQFVSQNSTHGTPPEPGRSGIQESTRRALQQQDESLLVEVRDISLPRPALRVRKSRSVEDLRKARRSPQTPTTSKSHGILRTARSSLNQDEKKGSKGVSLRQTFRKMFGRATDEEAPSSSADRPTTEGGIRSGHPTMINYPTEALRLPESHEPPNSPPAGPVEPVVAYSAYGSEAEPQQRASSDQGKPSLRPTTASPKTLRRTTSGILNVTAPISPWTSTNLPSPAYPQNPTASQPSFRTTPPPPRGTDSKVARHRPPGRSSEDTTRSSGQQSQRDSLDVQRSRYNTSRGRRKEDDFDWYGEASSLYRRKPNTLSMHNNRGSIGSPTMPKQAELPSLTAPRQMMEAASIHARLTDLENRVSEMERTIYEFRNSQSSHAVILERHGPFEESPSHPSRPFLTPPWSKPGSSIGGDTFLRDHSSTSTPDEKHSPATPPPDEIAVSPAASPRTPELQTESQLEVPGLPEKLLRDSLLEKGFNQSLQHVFDAVNSEHNARLTLEANVASLRQALIDLRGQTVLPGTNTATTDQGTDTTMNTEESYTEHATHARSLFRSETSGARDYEEIDDSNPESPLGTTWRDFQPSDASQTSNYRNSRNLLYNDLWSYMAVPVSSTPQPLQNATRNLAEELADAEGPGLVGSDAWNQPSSRFSFNDTTDDEDDGADPSEMEDTSQQHMAVRPQPPYFQYAENHAYTTPSLIPATAPGAWPEPLRAGGLEYRPEPHATATTSF